MCVLTGEHVFVSNLIWTDVASCWSLLMMVIIISTHSLVSMHVDIEPVWVDMLNGVHEYISTALRRSFLGRSIYINLVILVHHDQVAMFLAEVDIGSELADTDLLNDFKNVQFTVEHAASLLEDLVLSLWVSSAAEAPWR